MCLSKYTKIHKKRGRPVVCDVDSISFHVCVSKRNFMHLVVLQYSRYVCAYSGCLLVIMSVFVSWLVVLCDTPEQGDNDY